MTNTDRARGRDQVLVAAYIAGATHRDAAERAGCSERTARRAYERHRDRIVAERDEMAERVAAEMLALVPAAADAYRDLVQSNVPGIRLAAARDVVSHALRWRDATEVEARLAALEATAPPRRPW